MIALYILGGTLCWIGFSIVNAILIGIVDRKIKTDITEDAFKIITRLGPIGTIVFIFAFICKLGEILFNPVHNFLVEIYEKFRYK